MQSCKLLWKTGLLTSFHQLQTIYGYCWLYCTSKFSFSLHSWHCINPVTLISEKDRTSIVNILSKANSCSLWSYCLWLYCFSWDVNFNYFFDFLVVTVSERLHSKVSLSKTRKASKEQKIFACALQNRCIEKIEKV